MRSLQGTWEGSLLDDNRIQVSGWTEMSFTASSDKNSKPQSRNRVVQGWG